MSRKKTQKPTTNRHFVFFVKTLDEDGFVDESKCGWLKFEPTELVFSFKNAFVFEEKDKGHGSAEDWKELIEEDHPNWRITLPPKYLD